MLVVGGGGVLGSAVLAELLAAHRFLQVAALVDQAVQTAVKGLVALPDNQDALHRFAADTALVVFDAERHSHRREAALVRPLPQHLPALAARLRASGVLRVVVVVPHRASLLPMASGARGHCAGAATARRRSRHTGVARRSAVARCSAA